MDQCGIGLDEVTNEYNIDLSRRQFYAFRKLMMKQLGNNAIPVTDDETTAFWEVIYLLESSITSYPDTSITNYTGLPKIVN